MSWPDDELLRRMLAELAGDPGEHPDLDTLADYLLGALTAQAEEQVQRHLVACPACTSELLDLEVLLVPGSDDPDASGTGRDEPEAPQSSADEPEPASPSGVVDLAHEASWRELRARLEATRQATRARRLGRLATAASAAAVLVAALAGGLALRSGPLGRGAARRPEPGAAAALRTVLNPPMVFLEPGTRGPNGAASQVRLGAADPLLILVLAPEELEPLEEYRVVVYEVPEQTGSQISGRPVQGRAPLWTGTGLQLTDHGTVRLVLPTRMLAAGTYAIELQGRSGPAASLRPVGEYALMVEADPEPVS